MALHAVPLQINVTTAPSSSINNVVPDVPAVEIMLFVPPFTVTLFVAQFPTPSVIDIASPATKLVVGNVTVKAADVVSHKSLVPKTAECVVVTITYEPSFGDAVTVFQLAAEPSVVKNLPL